MLPSLWRAIFFLIRSSLCWLNLPSHTPPKVSAPIFKSAISVSSKLCANSTGNPVQAMSGLGSFEIASSEVGRAITIHLGAESARVGLALGYKIPKFNGNTAEQWAAAGQRDVYEKLDRQLTPTTADGRNWRSSMGQDVTKGRPTEIDYMNGHVVMKGREVGVPTPVSAATVEMVREIDAGTRKPEAKNIETVLRRAGV